MERRSIRKHFRDLIFYTLRRILGVSIFPSEGYKDKDARKINGEVNIKN